MIGYYREGFNVADSFVSLFRGLISINGTVVTYLPAFTDPEVRLWMPEYPTYESCIQQILNETLQNEPGSAYLYLDLNYMTMMLVIEKVTGKHLNDVVYEYISAMEMKDTFFNRGNVEGPAFPFYRRMATQEFQIPVLGDQEPQRHQPVRRTVHDENA
ncbi:hypothetical protein F5Y09DRAFT_346683 [Xylaria sp. FL1042]|nr:hypothetical protein F5Y09DRAFT_346683 [Xylaria sp. FL1042]